MSLGTVETQRGALTRGHVELGRYPDGPVLSPVMIAAGAQDGPTLWVQAGVHGPEVVGQLALAHFLAQDVIYGGNAVHLKARTGGFWRPIRWPGERVREGDPKGEVLDVFGAATVRCTYPQGWIGLTRRPYMPIYAGDQAVELVETVRF